MRNRLIRVNGLGEGEKASLNYFKQKKTIYGLLLVIWVCLLWGGDALAGPDPLRSPWPAQFSSLKPELQGKAKPRSMPENGLWQGFFLQAIRGFQIFISPADGDRCPMSPSCSHYAVEAIRRYGPWRGIILTSDRLLRCGRETDYLLIHDQGGFHYYDPLEDNIIWKTREYGA